MLHRFIAINSKEFMPKSLDNSVKLFATYVKAKTTIFIVFATEIVPEYKNYFLEIAKKSLLPCFTKAIEANSEAMKR
jgi:hypothetical protein